MISRDESESGLGIIPQFKSMGLLVLLGLKSFGIPSNSKNFFISSVSISKADGFRGARGALANHDFR